MSLARLVVTAVKIEGRTKASVARDYGIARSWVHELMRRYECEGEAGSSRARPRHADRGNRAAGLLVDCLKSVACSALV